MPTHANSAMNPQAVCATPSEGRNGLREGGALLHRAARAATPCAGACAKPQETTMAKELRDQEAIKQDVMARMKRIEGQVRGIQRMIEEGKECEDILVQVRAVRSALRSATGQIMRRYLLRCQEQSVTTGDPVAQYEKLVKLISDFIDG